MKSIISRECTEHPARSTQNPELDGKLEAFTDGIWIDEDQSDATEDKRKQRHHSSSKECCDGPEPHVSEIGGVGETEHLREADWLGLGFLLVSLGAYLYGILL